MKREVKAAAVPPILRNNVPAGLGEISLDDVIGRMEDAAAPYDDLILIGHSVGGLLVWLHKQVMKKMAENGGNVPSDLKD